jgi:hypothetical protein
MTWKFYACVVIVLAYGAAVVWLKMDARRRIREEAEEKARIEAIKSAPPPPERPPQAENFEVIDSFSRVRPGPKNPWDLTEEDLERRMRGG